MRTCVIVVALMLGTLLVPAGGVLAEGDEDSGTRIFIGEVTTLDLYHRTMALGRQVIWVPNDVAGLEGLAPGSRVVVRVETANGRRVATELQRVDP
jgi:hypothetical protein